MRPTPSALACVLALGTFVSDAGLDAQSFDPRLRVRPMHVNARTLIEKGIDGSPTFRRLVERLQQSDVIVYVQLRHDMPNDIGGALRFLSNTPDDRYLRVTINGRHNQPMLIALLGHELQHALEIAGAPEVTSPEAMATYYRRVGLGVRPDRYDSRAAQETGWLVREELRGRSATRVAAKPLAFEAALLSGGSIAAP